MSGLHGKPQPSEVYWVNVYANGATGGAWPSREEAVKAGGVGAPSHLGAGPVIRLRVRPKIRPTTAQILGASSPRYMASLKVWANAR